MTVLFLVDAVYCDLTGGSRMAAAALAAELTAMGHEVTFLAPTVGEAEPSDDIFDGIRIVRYAGSKNPLIFVQNGKEACRKLWKARAFDIVHTHFAYAAVGPLMAIPASVPRIRTFHGPWDQELWLESTANRPGPVSKAKAAIKAMICRIVEGRNLKSSNAILTLSNCFRDLVINRYGISPDSVRVAPGGTDLEKFQLGPGREEARRTLDLPTDRRILISVRRLVPRMGLANLVDAMQAIVAKHPDVLLLIGGTGPEANRLSDRIESLGLQGHVRLVGFIPDKLLPTYYRAADLFVLPTIALEGFGLVTVDALAGGLPVIATPIGANVELLADLDSRLVTRDSSAVALSETVCSFLEGDWAKALTPARLRSFVADRFTWPKHAGAVADTYAAVIKHKLAGSDSCSPNTDSGSNVHAAHHRLSRLPVSSGRDTRPLKVAPSDKTTILYLDHTAALGGGEIALRNLIYAMDKSKYDLVVAFASQGPLVESLSSGGIETHVFELDRRIVNTRKERLGAPILVLRQLFTIVKYALNIAKFARSRRVDVIHTNSLKSDIYGGVAGRIAGIPVVWHIRDSITPSYLPAPAVIVFRFLSRVLPSFVVANSASTLSTLRLPKIQKSQAVVPSGTASREYHEVVHDGIVGDGTLVGAPFDEPKRGSVIALVGRIAEWKGQHIFLRSARLVLNRFPNVRFWIIGAPLFGEQQYESSLKSLAVELGIAGSVDFLGFRNDIPRLMQEADIIAHASIIGEPFGQVVIEGMAAAKPVVATNGGAIPEIITDRVDGLLVPMADHVAMANAFGEILCDPEMALSIGLAARDRVTSAFTMDLVRTKMESVYSYICSSGDHGDSFDSTVATTAVTS